MIKDITILILFIFIICVSRDFVKARALSGGSSLSRQKVEFFSSSNSRLIKREDDGFGIDGNFGNGFEVEVDEDEKGEAEEANEEVIEEEIVEEEENEEAENEDQDEEEVVEEEEEEEPEEEVEEEVEEGAEEEVDDNKIDEQVNRDSNIGRRAGNSKGLSSRGGPVAQNGFERGSNGRDFDKNNDVRSNSRKNFDQDSVSQDAGVEKFAAKLGAVVKSIGEGLGIGSRVDNEQDSESTVENSNSRSRNSNGISSGSNSDDKFNSRKVVSGGSQGYEDAGNRSGPRITPPMNNVRPEIISSTDIGHVRPNSTPKSNNQIPNNAISNQIN